MTTLVISYSFTGNNDELASAIAAKTKARHVKVVELKKRTNGTIALDMLFNRVPRILAEVEDIGSHDLVIFVSPIWMGQVATPLRACFKKCRLTIKKYAFVSISGGADGPNSNIEKNLKKWIGKDPEFVLDMHIVEFLPKTPRPTREVTSTYRITEREVSELAEKVINAATVKVILK